MKFYNILQKKINSLFLIRNKKKFWLEINHQKILIISVRILIVSTKIIIDFQSQNSKICVFNHNSN